MKEVGNTSLVIEHSLLSTTSGGVFTVTSPPSLKVKADNEFIYSGVITFSFTGGNSTETLGGTGTFTTGTMIGTGTINPSAIKLKADGTFTIRKDDIGVFSVLTGTFVTSGGTTTPNTPAPNTGVIVSDAGQIKVLGN